MDTGILDIPLSLRGELFAKIRGVLVLDVLHNRIPATFNEYSASEKGFGYSSPSIIVDLIAISWSIHNVEAESHTILLNDCTELGSYPLAQDEVIYTHCGRRSGFRWWSAHAHREQDDLWNQ